MIESERDRRIDAATKYEKMYLESVDIRIRTAKRVLIGIMISLSILLIYLLLTNKL